MEKYKLYLVQVGNVRPGKYTEAMKWWKEEALPNRLTAPWFKSIKAYAGQFGLGGEYVIEIWNEIESYGAFDQIDDYWDGDSEDKEKRLEIIHRGAEIIEWGPSRLMGDWPESAV